MNDYRNLAKRCISLFAGGVSSKMIKDEDAISHVAEHIMWGHLRWKEDGGRAIKSYLNQCAIWAIKIWQTKMYQTEKMGIMSLNHVLSNGSDDGVEQHEIIPDTSALEPSEIICEDMKIKIKSIFSNKKLTLLQKKCLKERYIEGKKLQQIADSLGVTRQSVNQHIKKAINKLKDYYGVC